ncbi:MAG: patatin family protein [Lachnospiraceae bacterium]|nr:patatin family protein [Lachnospiraceae bacterium]
MVGLIDIGGGMRDAFGAGVLDAFLDRDVKFPYCIGVSAGSGNLASYLAGQRGRNLRFYEMYSPRPQYMGMKQLLTTGNYFNLQYIYGDLTVEGGEDPLDWEKMQANPAIFKVAACNVKTGKTIFFNKKQIPKDDYRVIMASSCVTAFNRPIEIDGQSYVDGGTAIPIPWRKAFADGCDKIAVIMTLREDDILEQVDHRVLATFLMARYPKTWKILMNRHKYYNRQVEELLRLESEGKAILIAPRHLYGVTTTNRDSDRLTSLYQEGYRVATEMIDAGRFADV